MSPQFWEEIPMRKLDELEDEVVRLNAELLSLREENAALREVLQAGFSMVKISGINTWVIDRGPPGLCQQFPTPDAAIDAAVKAMKEAKP